MRDAIQDMFTTVAASAAHVARARSAAEEVAELTAVRLSPSVAAWVDFFATHELSDRFGALGWFGAEGGYTVDWLPGAGTAFAHSLAQPYRLRAMLAGALPLGCDHGGNMWLVDLVATGEVFYVNSDLDEARFACDSLATFARLLLLLEQGVPDEEIEAELATRADLAFLAEQAVLDEDHDYRAATAPLAKSTLAERMREGMELVSAFELRISKTNRHFGSAVNVCQPVRWRRVGGRSLCNVSRVTIAASSPTG